MSVQDPDALHGTYESPLVTRYASAAMQALFAPRHRFRLWRRLWVALAAAQYDLGLDLTAAQVAELRAHQDDLNLEVAHERERQVRHDVMAHVYAFGEQCPTARGVIHLGATSCFVTDNADLLVLRDALGLVHDKLLVVLENLASFARTHRALPCLAFTHYQPAQPTTVGKRACLWAQDLLIDAQNVARVRTELRFRGVKGTTGTQASFLALFDGDHARVEALDRQLAASFGFERSWAVTGQTYPRKQDVTVMHALEQFAASAGKFAGDLRLLAHDREIEEPFEPTQIGSSAMPYKRNPMRCERISALARFLVHTARNAVDTAMHQWLERSLDDSANRRLALAEAFLAADGILALLANVTGGLVANEAMIRANLKRELPFMATEEILMAAVQQGGDRQALHERLRQHSQTAAAEVKGGRSNDLMDRIQNDEAFAAVAGTLVALLDPARPAFIGRAPQQVDAFLTQHLDPYIAQHATSSTVATGAADDIRV